MFMNKLDRNIETIVACILEVIVGILLIINPIGFTSGIIVGLGIAMAVLGVISIVGYFRTEPEEAEKKNGLFKGLLFSVGGLFCIFRPTWLVAVFPLFTVFYGILILILGFRKIQWAIDMLRRKQKYWFVALIGAILSLVFAILILINPFASTAILWTFIAVSLIIEAVADILTLIFKRK